MANGLHVVSVRIPVVENAAIGKLITYYDEHPPEKIADAIKAVDLNVEYDSKGVISKLDKDFIYHIKELF
jgi:hypothetical protein